MKKHTNFDEEVEHYEDDRFWEHAATVSGWLVFYLGMAFLGYLVGHLVINVIS